MDWSTLKLGNPRLFYDGIARGKIPYSEIPVSEGLLYPGNGATTADTWVGGPHAPEPYSFDPDTENPLGASGMYPKPWLSYSQRLTNANYTYIGGYARMIGWADGDCSGGECEEISICCTGEDSDSSKYTDGFTGIWGRLGVVQTGSQAGGLGFYPMNWQTDTTGANSVDHWNNHFNLSGNGLWQSKEDWWAACSKKVVTRFLGNTGLKVRVQVAVAMIQFDDPEYWRGMDLATTADYSFDLLIAMVGIAVAMRWL